MLGAAARLRIGGKHRVQRIRRSDGGARQRVAHHRGNLGEADTALQKCLDRHLVGRIQHRRRRAAGAQGVEGQGQAREAVQIGRFERKRAGRGQIQQRHAGLDALGYASP